MNKPDLFQTLLLMVLACIFLGGFYSMYLPTDASSADVKTWRYRITVSVNTPEGLKSGSTVREVIYSGPTRGGAGSGISIKCRGEAVVIDLAPRGVLFAMTAGDDCSNILLKIFRKDGVSAFDPSNIPNSGKVVLEPGKYPEYAPLVTFSNLNDPTTARGVNYREMEKTFGSDVNIHEVTVEMTNDPITWGIEKWLPWLPQKFYARGTVTGGPKGPRDDPTGLYLQATAFSIGRF
ncbi:MAG: hypothetical protein JNM12_08790 [Alphaproteobacteria bacterium]|nr:hypothetical protein [Alphaproteobacteria bacterium]